MSHFTRQHFYDIDIKDLILKYKEYNCLWNYNSPNYKNRSMKQKAWQEIANYFQKDVNEVKRKIKYLRSAYVGEKRKVEATKKSETPHKPVLFYYKEFNFLDNIVILRKYEKDAEDINIEFGNTNASEDTLDNDDLGHFGHEEDDLKEPAIECKIESLSEYETETPLLPISIKKIPKIAHSQSITSRPVKRRVNGEIKSTRAQSDSTHDARRKDLYTSFGKMMSLQLQELPLEVAIMAMSEIHTILTRKTLEHIRSLQKDQERKSYSESETSCNDLIEEYFNDSS